MRRGKEGIRRGKDGAKHSGEGEELLEESREKRSRDRRGQKIVGLVGTHIGKLITHYLKKKSRSRNLVLLI